MTRNVHTFMLCVAGLALGGCYDHRTVEETAISPITGEEDAGSDQPANNGGDNGGDNSEANGPDEEDAGAPQGPFGDLDCEDPPDRITELLCGLQQGGDNASGGFPGASGGGFPGASGGQGGATNGRPGGSTSGRPGGTGGFPGSTNGGMTPPDPADIIQQIIDSLDCDAKDPDFITQLLCSLTGAGGTGPGTPGGTRPGGGRPPGGGAPGGGTTR